MRKTKIVCTLGPATDDDKVLRGMINAGMNVARLNFSHGSHEEHKARADKIKALRTELDIPIALMIDTKGPDIRVGRFKNNFVELRSGDTFTLTASPYEGDAARVSVTYSELCRKLSPGDSVMLDDGLIDMRVISATDTEAVCTVINGGVISNNKSVNVPGVKLNIPYMREKDVEDINFAIDNDFDYVAASFVRSAEDVWQVRRILEARGAGNIRIISKIENSEGIENIDEILELSDSIMIARGDMGVELPFVDLPAIQKRLIKKALSAGKKAITATQMLDSMIKNPRPTRAEVSDVANAIYDGTGAIMLSGETSVGLYPVETVTTMARIAEVAEADINYENRFFQLDWKERPHSTTDAISYAVCTASYQLGLSAIFALTQSGTTAQMVSRYRPAGGFIAFTPDEKVFQQLSLVWGCTPIKLKKKSNQDEMFRAAGLAAKAKGLSKDGDHVIYTAGLALGSSGGTNMMHIDIIGAKQ